MCVRVCVYVQVAAQPCRQLAEVWLCQKCSLPVWTGQGCFSEPVCSPPKDEPMKVSLISLYSLSVHSHRPQKMSSIKFSVCAQEQSEGWEVECWAFSNTNYHSVLLFIFLSQYICNEATAVKRGQLMGWGNWHHTKQCVCVCWVLWDNGLPGELPCWQQTCVALFQQQ